MEARSHPTGSLRGLPPLRVVYSNVRSLFNKMDEVRMIASRYEPSILAFSETWLNAEVPDAAISIPGYMLARVDRPESRGGGGLIL